MTRPGYVAHGYYPPCDIVTVDADGRGVSRDNIQVSIPLTGAGGGHLGTTVPTTTGADSKLVANGNVRTVDVQRNLDL